jgi:DNA adenine methylase
VFVHGERFAKAIETAEVSVDAWHRANATYLDPSTADEFELGYSTFFLNRTNRSGILTARPIGGLDQTGNWKIDARFNRPNLAERVRMLYSFRRSVEIYELDALEFMEKIETSGQDTFVYVDPPYIQQGDDLYMHAFDGDAHAALSIALGHSELPWVLTYDAHKRISEDLYALHRCAKFDISHTAQKQHIGSEFVLFSKHLNIPDLQVTPNRAALLLDA